MKTFLDTLAPHLLNILSPLLVAVLTWASWKMANYIKAHTKNQQVQAALLRLNDAVATAVESVEQTLVSNFKMAGNGKLSPDDGAKARTRALDQIKSNLGTKGLSDMMSVLGVETTSAMDGLLAAKVEAHVFKLSDGPRPIINKVDLSDYLLGDKRP
jgi:hypothetical protein